MDGVVLLDCHLNIPRPLAICTRYFRLRIPRLFWCSSWVQMLSTMQRLSCYPTNLELGLGSGEKAWGARRKAAFGIPDAKMCARGLTTIFVVLLLLSSSLAAQSSREKEAERDIETAKQAQARGDYVQAVAGYQAAVKLLPNVPELYSNLGIACYLQKDYPSAIAALQRAV
jgi:tetratricopeptide (TPR) repeat protein